jgi:two-component system response regulator HydG
MQRKPTIRTITAVHPLNSGARRPPARVFIISPRAIAARIDLGEGIVAFGRGQMSTYGGVFVELMDDTVSRNHFVVAWVAAQGVWVIKDLGSRNGTWVDGVKVGDAFIPVGDNAVIRAGHVILVFEVGEEPSAEDAAAVSTTAIPGEANASRALRAAVGRAGRDPSPVLVFGETGVGKELIAGEIHRLSGRAGELIAINCAALSRELIESQLFGHERGAFTGAHARKLGRFELAHGGTVFLDEIGSLRLDLQAKLLRVLQEREIERLGGSRPVPVDVRVLAATNVNLRQAVRDRAFREDLFYRLNVVPLHVPPLRERREDIPRLVRHFVKKIARECHRDVRDISAGALDALARYGWPGNVRELENVIHRAVVLSRGPIIQLQDVPLDVAMPETSRLEESAATPLREACDRFERQYVLRVLERVHWNVSRAARLLGVHRNTILAKLATWGVRRPGSERSENGGGAAI